MTRPFKRREILKTGSAAIVGLAIEETASGRTAPGEKPIVRVGVIGTGNRGKSLLATMLHIKGLEFPALCDIDPVNLAAAQDLLAQAGRPKAEAYIKGEAAYLELVARDDLDAVIIATPWKWHAPMAVAAMRAGKYAGVEVPAAQTIEECWQLVRTHEETGVPCMMLENWSFRRDNLAVLNLIRAGLLGEIVHCHCAHSHDCIDHWFFDKQGNMRWGADYLIRYNRDQYPTHSLGPVLSWLDINCGDNFATLTSTASSSRSINRYFARKFGADHPNAKREYSQGDIVTSVVRTHGGKTIVINYDMQLPRPYDNRWMVQGTMGLYDEDRSVVYITEKSPKYHEWEPFAPYQERYEHQWWREMNAAKETAGHGGTDYLELDRFMKAVRARGQTPIDVYDSAVMSSVVALSQKSIAGNSITVECPDFTRGAWKHRKPRFAIQA